jgi:signal transduction histidine kinase
MQDEERRRIGRELHDSTAQLLAGASMSLALAQRLATGISEPAQRALAESVALIAQCSQEIRTISYLLHPPLLDEVGLAAAVRWYADGFEKRSGILVDVETSAGLGRLPQDMETALFRIVQECLSNVHRHSGSTRVRIRVARDPEAVCLRVEDAGGGMAGLKALPDGDAAMGVGIMGMRERVRQLGGQLDIRSGATGTAVDATLPLIQPLQPTAQRGSMKA